MIELSPTSARRVQECSAGYLLQYHLLPRTESQEVKDIVRNGSQFHMIGERNFSPEAIAQYLAYLPKEQSLALMKMVDTATSRYYMNQEYEFSSEKKYLYQLSPKWAFRGITDRRVKIKDDVHIIDWKTTANPRPYHDIIQIKGYGFLEHKIEGTPVEKIQLILDYVNANTMTEVDFLEEDVPLYEHYLCRLFEEAEHIIARFESEGRNLNSIQHTPGSHCTFCIGNGKCLAYRLALSPSLDSGGEIEKMSTEEIVDELRERSQVLSLYGRRSDALKSALLFRNQSGDEKVKEMCSVVTNKLRSFNAAKVIQTIVPVVVRRAVKENALGDDLDVSLLVRKIRDLMKAMLPESLSRKAIPEEFIERVERFEEVSSGNPYIKLKKIAVAREGAGEEEDNGV